MIELKRQKKQFNLIKYFMLSSAGFFVLITLLLGVVFITHQKRLLTEYAASSVEVFSYQISNRFGYEDINFIKDDQVDVQEIETLPAFKQLDERIRSYLFGVTDIVLLKVYDRKGRTVYSPRLESLGEMKNEENLRLALYGKTQSRLMKDMLPMSDIADRDETDILEIYVPIYGKYNASNRGRRIIGAFEIQKDMSMIFNEAKIGGISIFALFTISMSLLFIILLLIIMKANRIINSQNADIDQYNRELEEAQHRITESIDEVIEHESFHVRYINENLAKCWEVKNCGQNDCPSYMNNDLRCWQVAGTFCGGNVQGYFANKYGDCRKCEVYKYAFSDRINMIGESFNNMMTLLQNKHLEVQEVNRQLNRLVDIDPLTQIGNRRSFQNRMENIHLHSLRYNRPYSIIVCDIDYFKLYNDTYGHQQGDYILVVIANTMNNSVRKTDEVFRWGGEEFVVILPEQNMTDALKVAENLRAIIEKLDIEHKKSKSGVVTISCGVSSSAGNNVVWEDILKHADDALYKAKQEGRNCVYSHNGDGGKVC